MKNLALITVIFSFLFQYNTLGQRQEISLAFTGITNGEYAQLSRIDIRNLKENCDTTLYWPDTVLSLIQVGIGKLHSFSKEFQVFQNTPNPVTEHTKILLYLPEDGEITVDVSLLNGKRVAFFIKKLDCGYHSFIFTPGGKEIYVFTTYFKTMKKSIKILSSTMQSSGKSILTYNGEELKFFILKSSQMSNQFVFSAGDTLRFIGYYNTFTKAFQDAPTINKSYIFNFPATGSSCPETPAITYMNYTYNTIQIGSQCWFRDNLNIGTKINGTQGQSNHGAIEKYCYNDDEVNCIEYGGLYQWNNAMQWSTNEGAQGICPPGWHIPTDNEWTELITFLGGVSVAGGKMKEAGTAHWASPNAGATNSSGFTGFPSGNRSGIGFFYNLTNYADIWSSSQNQNDTNAAWTRGLNYNTEEAYRSDYAKIAGFSVRCLQD